MNAFLWSGRVNSISISVVFFPSKDALYGFFYGTALTKYICDTSSVIVFNFKSSLTSFHYRGVGITI